MKKLLALVLALVMTLGLATVGANAAEFSDQSDISYDEAVKVLSTVGVLGGEGDNKFNPKGELTRAAGAKIIAYLDLGEATAESMPAVQVFDDVPATHWAAKYVSYCANAGIIGGVGNNKFDPDAPLTGYAFGKMLLCVLGYDADIEGYTGANWQINVAKGIGNNDIDKKIDKAGSLVLTREEAAQYAFNALKANMVEYQTKGTTVSVGGSAQVTVGASKAEPYNGPHSADITNEAAGPYVQLGEKLYKGDLKIDTVTVTDDMGRPSTDWTWKTNTEIGNYAKDPDYKVVVKKSGKSVADIIDDINKNLIDNTATFKVYRNSNTTLATGAGAAAGTAVNVGDVLEIYMDDNIARQVDTVAISRYAAAKATDATLTKGSGSNLEVRVPGIINSYTKADYVTGYEGIEKDDIVYWYTGVDSGNTTYHLAKAEKVEGQLTTIKTSSTPYKYVIGGADYLVNGSANNATVALTGTDGNLAPATTKYNTNFAYYLDDNGLIVYAKQLEETNKNYVVLNALQYASSGSLTGSSRVEARIVRMDGSTEVVKVASIETATDRYIGTTNLVYSTANTSAEATAGGKTGHYLVGQVSDGAGTPTVRTAVNNDLVSYATDGLASSGVDGGFAVAVEGNTSGLNGNGIFTYKINSDGEYELTSANQTTDVTTGYITNPTSASYASIKPNSGRLAGAIAVNDSTVFVVVNDPNATTLKYKTFTGKANAPTLDNASSDVKFVYAAENSVATAVFVYDYSSKSDTGNKIFILHNGSVATAEGKDADGNSYTYYVYPALVDGAVTQIGATSNAIMTGEYSPNYDSNGLFIWGAASNNSTRTNGNTTVANRGGTPAGETIGSVTYTALPAFGYSMEGSTLVTGRTYGADDVFANSYNCPGTATVVRVDKDDNFTVGTAATDIGYDKNDQIFVVLTNNSDNTVKTVFIVERAEDETGMLMAPVYYDDDTTNVFESKGTSTATIAGKTTSYTTYGIKTGGTTQAKAIKLFLKAGCKVEFNTTGWGTAFAGTNSVATELGANLGNNTGATTGATGTTYYVRVTAEDGSYAYYQIVNT